MSSCPCKKIKADYIIAGGGNAGLTLAKLLSDVQGVSVIVLEAGSNISDDVNIKNTSLPNVAYVSGGDGNPRYINQGMSLTSPSQAATLERPYQLIMGRGTGGGSAVNGMQYVRDTVDCLNQWATIAGPGGEIWAAANSIPNGYTPLETYFGNPGPNPTRGTTGPVHVRLAPRTQNVQPTTKLLIDTLATYTGNPTVDDFNLPQNQLCQSYSWNLTQEPNSPHYRVSSATAFLDPYVQWSADNTEAIGTNGRKLRVLTQTTVDKVIWDYCDGVSRAVGVRAIRDGVCCNFYAKREVILSAGLHSTPILQRSGVGDASYLSNLGIDVVFNNPNVGENMQNHPISPRVVLVNQPNDNPLYQPQDLYVGAAFAANPVGDPKRRSVQVIGFEIPGFGVGPNVILFEFVINQTTSKGYVRIQNKDPFAVPLVQQNLLGTQEDIDQMVESFLKYIIPTIRDLVDNHGWILAEPFNLLTMSREELTAFVLKGVSPAYHYVSSNLMKPLGPKGNGGVVNPVGQVYGVEGLRVVDDSIIPQPDGNTQSTAYLVGWIIGNIMKNELLA